MMHGLLEKSFFFNRILTDISDQIWPMLTTRLLKLICIIVFPPGVFCGLRILAYVALTLS